MAMVEGFLTKIEIKNLKKLNMEGDVFLLRMYKESPQLAGYVIKSLQIYCFKGDFFFVGFRRHKEENIKLLKVW